MAKSPRHAGNMNLRGKRSKPMPCGCCDCIDLKTPMLERIERREALAELLEMDGQICDDQIGNPDA